jgi:hypothetical protein
MAALQEVYNGMTDDLSVWPNDLSLWLNDLAV